MQDFRTSFWRDRDKNEYIVEPMTAKTKLTMYKGGADISGVPSVVMALEVEQVNIAWSDAEYASALRIARDIAAFNRKSTFHTPSPLF